MKNAILPACTDEAKVSRSIFPAQKDAKSGDEMSPRLASGLRILIAEDVLTNQMVVEAHLKRLGCECICVPNGREAVMAVSENDFDAILMDMAMPVMDGPAAVRAIRKLAGERGRLPIIALTAYARAEEIEPMLAAGANAIVVKPVDVTELAEALSSITRI